MTSADRAAARAALRDASNDLLAYFVRRVPSPEDAADLYGKSKFLGEVATPNALTLRTSIIGRELSEHRSLLDWFLAHNGRRVQGYQRAIYSGITTNEMSAVVARVITDRRDLSGVYQVASEPVSKHELLVLIRDAFGLDITIVVLEGKNKSTLALQHLCYHIVDQTVLVRDLLRFEVCPILLFVDFLEDILEPSVVCFQNSVLSAHVQWPFLVQGVLEACVCEALYALGGVIH